MHKLLIFKLFSVILILNETKGFYIKQESIKAPVHEAMVKSELNKNQWNPVKRKFINQNKVKPFGKQETALQKFLAKFDKEHTNLKSKSEDSANDMHYVFTALLDLMNKNLKQSRIKSHNRPRRRVSLQMISDISAEKIDELIKMFNEENEINTNEKVEKSDDSNYYDFDLAETKDSSDNDYLYENLYEDEQDMTLPKSTQNSEFGSIQDLILKATQNQWQREQEETKLRNVRHQHFI